MSLSTISSFIKVDHTTLNELYKNYMSAQGTVKEQEHLTRQFQTELTKHSAAEEMIVYPAFEQYLGAEGKQIADKDRAEHQTVKNFLSLLESTSVSDSQHQIIFGELMLHLNEHIESEETNDLPKLENAITSDLSTSLAYRFQQIKTTIDI